MSDLSRVEDILDATIKSEPYDEPPQSRVEEKLVELKKVIEEGGGGGGSVVSITPTLESGTKIADYSINGHEGELYAPTPSGGSTTLSGLTDVDLSSPMDGQGLVYDEETGKWVNSDVGGGGSSLDQCTLPEYNDLTQQQQMDGTARFIPASNVGTTSEIDCTDITGYYENHSVMDVTAASDSEIDITYSGGVQIGCNFRFNDPIDVTNWDKIIFKVLTGSCYGGGSTAQQTRWNLQVGLLDFAITQAMDIPPTDSRWKVVANMPDANHDYGEVELDVSDLTGELYLTCVCHGWNAVLEDFALATNGYSSRIMYMGNTYGMSNSGSGAVMNKLAQFTGEGAGWAGGATITLSESMRKYDMLMFTSVYSSGTEGFSNAFVNVGDFISKYTTRLYHTYNAAAYGDLQYLTDTTISVLRTGGAYTYSVYGIKFGAGGGEFQSTPQIYRVNGVFVDSHTDTDFFGRGVADITITGNLAKIDFQIITKMNNYTGRSDVYDWGINPALISQLNSDIPLITPIAGSGTWDPFNFNSDRMGFGTSFDVFTGINRWTPVRNYLIDNPTAYGAWSEYEMPWPFRGTCYGKIN